MRLFALILLAACTSPDPKESKESSGDSTAVDVDSDGFVVGEDCDDGNAAINPGAKESCDGIDNNCDELIDDSSSIDQPLWYGDDDGDGYGADATSTSACTQPAGYVATGGDCNDNDPLYHPGADESCESAEDYNCDGSVEYADADADGFPACLDCNDGDPGIHEGAAERCDGLDQDCDGVIDEDAVDATAWYQDSDADSHGDASVSQTACEAPAGFVASSDDCNDADAAFYPGATETCEDPQDYNCDGSVGGADNDGDGFLACLECDDGDAAINPSAEEICDGLDNNCDGAIDDNSGGASTWYVDADLDGYGDPSASLSACTQPAGYVADNTDCNDQDAAYNPGAAEADCTDPNDYNCDGSSGFSDTDGDGFPACEDCDDTRAEVNPDGIELCNGLDDNCDGSTDDSSATDAQIWYIDADADGYGLDSISQLACAAPTGYVADNTDCSDSDAGSYPGATEFCDGVDNNCDGTVDEDSAADALEWYQDSDADGFGDATTTTFSCSQPTGFVPDATDCDDSVDTTYPGATEYCNGDDDNCDGVVDEDSAADAPTWYRDADVDGYGAPSLSRNACFQPIGYVSDDTDCNDAAQGVNPGEIEICDSGNVDEDCNGLSDDGDVGVDGGTFTEFYEDADGDSYGSIPGGFCDLPAGYVTNSTDCDDGDAAINPAATEICDSGNVDEDCDGSADDNDSSVDASTFDTWYQDSDADTYGNLQSTLDRCDLPSGYVADSRDCNDGDATINPSATEICDSSNVDEDCDGLTDDADSSVSSATKSTWYQDSDADTYGNLQATIARCDLPSGYVANSTDCNDTNAAINPAATEICDSSNVDEDCDGVADDSDSSVSAATKSSWYQDSDGDSYGNLSISLSRCDQPAGYVSSSTDCNDSSAVISPAATEICDSGNVDEDCDGVADDNDSSTSAATKSTWYRDADGDTYGTTATTLARCDLPSGYVANSTDCNDSAAAINPAATEICDSSNVDEDCDGVADDSDSSVSAATKSTWYRDSDSDTYGNLSVTIARCDLPSGYVANSTDCNDSAAAINPGATEVCDSSNVDEDCDGLTDDNDSSVSTATRSTWYRDADTDTYGTSATTLARCDQPSGYVANSTDCNDSNAAISPAATEVCDSSNVDEDCDGLADDNDSSVSAATRSTWYRDADNDTYGNLAVTLARCDLPSGYVANSTDCNDAVITINPGATEICDSGNVDENCNGTADDNDSTLNLGTRTRWYQDSDSDSYGNATVGTSACDAPTGYVASSTDCNDGNNAINPGATEVCDSGDRADTDENCNGRADDGDSTVLASSKSNFYFDSDSDNYGDLLIPLAACNTPVGYVSNSTDCNDNLAAINPGATEVCDSSNVDEDCDGLSDDADITVEPSSYSLWYRDADGDNYGLTASTTYTCDLPSGYTSVGGDCNDSSSSISPAATEICDSGNVDENCNGSADDNDSTVNAATKSTWYRDADTDTYGLSSESISRCDLPAGYVANSTDCDDAQSTVNPGITESPTYCKDGLDNDCDNVDDCRDVGLLVDTAADVTLLGINGSPSAAAFFAGTVARGEYDVTGDGYGDLAIGDREFDPTTAAGDANKGRMYLLRGGASGLQDTVAAPRATMNGVANADRAGSGLSFVTDINNDGVDELAVGAYLANPSVSGSALTDAGAAYLFKGSSSLTGTLSPTVNSTAPASAFISITGAVTKDYAGWAIADGGDLTGDFVNDWVVAGYAPTVVAGNTNIGRVAVISGTASSGTWTISSTTQNAAVISGAASGDRLGVSVVGNTDLDGDGLNELLATSAQLGITYIFEAPLSGSLTPVNASASLTGHDIVVSSVFEVNCSPCISSIGDSDGDEYEDLVVGADGYDTTGATNKGAAYLVRGGSSLPNGSVATLSVAQVYGSISSDFAGRAVGGGDFDGNGLGDMVVGASGFDSPLVGAASNTGAAVIIYGPATGSYSVSSLSGSNYAAWLGSSSSANLGAEVGGVGDLNGDGFDDWFLGAPNYNPGVRVGQGYLFYGVGE